MRAYSEVYLYDVVENQGKLFDFVSQNYPKKIHWILFMLI